MRSTTVPRGSSRTWIGIGAARSGITCSYVINQHDARVEVYVDRGNDSYKEIKALLGQLEVHEAEIERSFGESHKGGRLESKSSGRIATYLIEGGYRDENRPQETFEAIVGVIVCLECAMSPHTETLRP